MPTVQNAAHYIVISFVCVCVVGVGHSCKIRQSLGNQSIVSIIISVDLVLYVVL